MIEAILKKIFGTKHERDVKRMMPVVAEINALEPHAGLDDAALRAKTDELRKRLADGAELERCCRRRSRCARGGVPRASMRHFDVQLIGGMVAARRHDRGDGDGEGKTRATLPRTSTRSPARACTSSPSTTTWPSATRSGWVRSITHSGCRSRDPARGVVHVRSGLRHARHPH